MFASMTAHPTLKATEVDPEDVYKALDAYVRMTDHTRLFELGLYGQGLDRAKAPCYLSLGKATLSF